ncbi:hypothetical protein TNCV_4152091 [Trichonephila clavipes]|nr:hypothetical protein TNCV_4152091 [Trichonephila clavipes]
MKRQLNSSSSPRAKNARKIKSKFKAMMITYSDIEGIVAGFSPESETIDQHYYLHILAELRERLRKKLSENRGRTSHWDHRDNALAAAFRFACQEVSCQIQHSSVRPSILFVGFVALRLLFFLEVKSSKVSDYLRQLFF